MAEKCEPKQNKCTKAGVGAECREPKYGAADKARCLQIVKRNCEEVRDKCIDECFANAKEDYDNDREREERAQKAAADQAREADRKCKEQTAYKDIQGYCTGGSPPQPKPNQNQNDTNQTWNRNGGQDGNCYPTSGLRMVYGKIAYLGSLYYGITGKTIVSASILSAFDRPQLTAYEKSLDAEKIKADYCAAQENARKTEEKLKKMCPPTPVPNLLSDTCKETIKYNARISRCISTCWSASMDKCDTRQCMCGSYKCEGPDITPDVPPPTPEPTPNLDTPVDFGRDTGSVTSSLSQYGLPMELLYGREFLFGNVIWISDTIDTVETTETISVFDSEQNVYVSKTQPEINNYMDYHIGLCAGPVDAITRVWLNGALVYDVLSTSPINIASQDRMRITTHTGEETSKVQEREAVEIGFGRVPAYRGLASAVITDINISDLGGFPSLRFEVVRSIENATVATEGDPIADIDYSFTRFDIDHRCVYVGSLTGVSIFNYDDFSLVREVPAVGPSESTSFPSLVTDDGVVDMVYGDVITAPALNVGNDITFVFRYVGQDNRGLQLFGNMIGGDVTLTILDDITGRTEEFAALTGIMSDAAETVTPLLTERAVEHSATLTAVTYSLFLARGDGTQIEVTELMCYNTDQHQTDTLGEEFAYDLIETGHYPYTVEDVFDGNTDVQLKGTLACPNDGTLVFFVSYDTNSVHKAIKWHPDRGVIWELVLTDCPAFGKYSPARKNIGRQFRFVSGTVASRIDLALGTVETISTGNPQLATNGPQFYDDQLGAVTYITTDDTLTRVYTDRVSEAATSVADVVLDVARRAGLRAENLDLTDIDDIELIGYRSGPNVTGHGILTNLFTAYPIISYVDHKIIFLKKGTSVEVTIDADDLDAPLIEQRLTDAYDTKTGTITYDSEDAETRAIQVFSLPDDPFSGRESVSADFPALLTDDYARSLAELLVFAAQENDIAASIKVPPRYLALTPADIAVITKDYRVKDTSTGWDLSTEASLYSDNLTKYNDLAEVAGVFGQTRVLGVDRYPKAVASLLTWPSRTILPSTPWAAAVNYGAANVVGFDTEGANVSQNPDENAFSAGAGATSFPGDIAYGRLITAPPECSNTFTTQLDASLVVKFAHPDHVTAFENANIRDLYTDVQQNALWVGQEIIQWLSYEIDMDGVTVTFTGLMRARQNTQQVVDHVPGELVVAYDPTIFDRVKLNGQDIDTRLKLIMTAPPEAVTRRDITLSVDGPKLFDHLGAYHVRRSDVEATVSPSVEFPANPQIIIKPDWLVPHAPNFPQYVDYPEFVENPFSAEIWLLRDTYDASAFEAARATFDFTDFSYVLDTGPIDTYYLSETDSEYYGWIYYTNMQDLALWEAATEKLVAVIITFGLYGETINVTEWTPGDYMRRPMEGLAYYG